MSYLRWITLLSAETGDKVDRDSPVNLDRLEGDTLTVPRSYWKRRDEHERWCRDNGYEESRYYIYWLATEHSRRSQQQLAVWWRPIQGYDGADVNENGHIEQLLVERDAVKFVGDPDSRSALIGYASETKAHRKAVIRALQSWTADLDDRYDGHHRPKHAKINAENVRRQSKRAAHQ